MSDPLNLAEIPESSRAEARRRLALAEQAQAILAGPRGLRTAAIRQWCQDRGVGQSTLRVWLAAYERSGFAGLLPGWGKTRGRFLALSEAQQDFLRQEYLSPQKPSRTTIYRHLEHLCAALSVETPCASTVNRFLDQLPPPAVILAREGPKAWRAKCEPKCERDFSDLRVGGWWVSDHREFDLFVTVEWWDHLARGMKRQIVRPWLTAWLDLRSRTLLGWQVSLSPNSETIACALRDGILRHGLPDHLYRDNGKDYTCHYWGGKSRTYRGVTLAEEACDLLRPGAISAAGVQLHAALPYTPWSKPIESWFGHTFPVWERTLPGWCGRDNKERPEKLAGEIARGELLTLEEFLPKVAERISDYNATPHSALEGATPDSLWDGVAVERPSPRTLDLLLMKHKPVAVSAQGIKLFGRRYSADELDLWVGRRVTVLYAPSEIGRLIVRDPATNQFVCEATNQAAMRMGASEAALKELHRRKRAAKQAAANYAAHRSVLFDPETTLAELSAQAREKKVIVLRPDPPPAAGVTAIPKLVPALDHAAQAIAAPATARARTRSAAPPDPPRSGLGDAAGEEGEQLLRELLADPAPRRTEHSEAEGESILRELLYG